MARHIDIRFVDQDIAVRALLLEEEMPRTCGEIIRHLPLEGIATHARYSGSEVAVLLPTSIRIERERPPVPSFPATSRTSG